MDGYRKEKENLNKDKDSRLINAGLIKTMNEKGKETN